jgi:hypothetical protein
MDFFEEKEDRPIIVYAELSKKQYNLIQTGQAVIEVPHGVQLRNRAGSRALYFSCINSEIAKELQDGLDDSAIAWQDDT